MIIRVQNIMEYKAQKEIDMPIINFMIDSDKEEKIIEFLLSEKINIVPDLEYKEEEYHHIRNIEEYKLLRKVTKQYFLYSNEWIVEKISMRKINKNNKNIYYLFPRIGGPVIILYIKSYDDKLKKVGFGSLHYEKKYQLKGSYNIILIPKEIEQFFKRMKNYLFGSSEKINYMKRKFYIDNELLNNLNNGNLKYPW